MFDYMNNLLYFLLQNINIQNVFVESNLFIKSVFIKTADMNIYYFNSRHLQL